jgi:prepilin-type N-terminal cleavage/methylation domain-containing protein
MRKAFTLVELIVVVIIIGILLSVGIPQYRKALERSRGAEGYAGLAHIQQAEKVYFATWERYYNTVNALGASGGMNSTDQDNLDISLPQVGWYFNVTTPNWSTGFTATARRVAGSCGGTGTQTYYMTVNENGTSNDSRWRDCVDSL